MAFKDWRLGTSTALFKNTDAAYVPEMLKTCADNGISCLEVTQAHYPNFGLIAKTAAEYGVTLWSIHLPFSREKDISLGDDEMREAFLDECGKLMKTASAYGVQIAVIHPSSEPIDDADRPARLARSHESLVRLAKFAKSVGMRLAVEDLPRTCLGRHSDEIRYMLDGNDDLAVCFDTNHLLIQRNEDFIKAVGSRIITLHVSDYDFVDERHWLPGNGMVDWKAVITLLEESGYSGPWMSEACRGDDCTAAGLRAAADRLAAL